MVAIERKMRAETEEELKELKQEKEALRSALLLIDGENTTLRGRPDYHHLVSPYKEKQQQFADMIVSSSSSSSSSHPPSPRSSSRTSNSSMTVAAAAGSSRPASLDLFSTLPPLPPSPAVSRPSSFIR